MSVVFGTYLIESRRENLTDTPLLNYAFACKYNRKVLMEALPQHVKASTALHQLFGVHKT